MKKTGFNLSTYWYSDRGLQYSLYLLLPLLVLLFTYLNYQSFAALDSEKRALSSKVQGMSSELAKLKAGAFPALDAAEITLDSAVKKTEEINKILERNAFSWSELLYSLESASPGGVSVKRIKPSYRDKKIRISGVAKNLASITDLVENLKESKYIKNSFLLRQDIEVIDKRHPAISFEIESEGVF